MKVKDLYLLGITLALWLLFLGFHGLQGRYALQRGLTGAYYNNPQWRGAPVFTTLDKALELRTVRERKFSFPQKNYSVRWTGWLYVPKAGEYVFKIKADDGFFLVLDDQSVVKKNQGDPSQLASQKVNLPKGFHPLIFGYFQRLGISNLEVDWRDPKGREEELPSHALFPEKPTPGQFRLDQGIRQGLRGLGIFLPAWNLFLVLYFLILYLKEERKKVAEKGRIPVIVNSLFVLLFVPLSLLLILIAVLSFQWRMELDSPILLYLAYLIDRFHYVPYRDFFDMNVPGIYMINLAVGHYLGYNDVGFRCADLLYLTVVSATTWLWLKKLGWKVAWCGIVLFDLLYLGYGPIMSMQREYFTLLPVSAAILVASFPQLNDVAKGAMVGFLFGLSAIIKPHAALGFPLVLLSQVLDIRQRDPAKLLRRSRLGLILLAAAFSFAVPILAVLVYLWRTEALPYFLRIAGNYWPLYVGLTGHHETIFGAARIEYLIKEYLTLGTHRGWLIPAGVGSFVSLFHSTLAPAQKLQARLLMGLAFCYSVYPVFAGQFWAYHWLPFLYFIVLLSSLCFVEPSKKTSPIKQLLPVAIILLAVFIRVEPPREFFTQIKGRPLEAPKHGRVDEIAAYLKARMEPGDKVQPLDWTSGAVHAMLLAKAQIATPFVYDFHFYHHVSSAYIQNLREQFLESLKASKPRFILQMTKKSRVSGLDTTQTFEGLEHLLNTYYLIAQRGNGYVIYERASNGTLQGGDEG